MKNKLLIALLFLFTGFFGIAQTINFLGSRVETKAGIGNISPFNYTIPSGQNRLMIVMVNFERDHRQYGVGGNYPGGSVYNAPPIMVGGNDVSVQGQDYFYTGHWNYVTDPNNLNWSDPQHTHHLNVYTMSEADGLPTGSTNFDFSNFNGGLTSADEMSVTILVYGNVSASSPLEKVESNWHYRIPANTTNLLTISGNAVSTPSGRAAADVLYVSLFGVSTDTSNPSASGWTQRLSTNVINSTGSAFSESGFSEADGLSSRVHERNYVSGNPSITYTRTSNTSDRLQGSLGVMYALKPIAKPGISGTVYRDNNGLPVNGGGTGGGLYNSSGSNILHVNVLNAAGTSVIATAQVNSSGAFNILEGENLVEGTTYILQLSKNKGTVGSAAPAKELHTNWTTVGESRNSSGTTDGSPDGLLTITLGDTNSITNRFGITETLCTAPLITSQPTAATYCQNRTATALSVTATGTSLSYQWYRNLNNNTTGATPVGTNSSTYTPVVTATGTLYYYVVVTSGTCSTPSDFVMVTVNPTPVAPVASANTLFNSCPITTANLTTLQPAAVSGQSYEWHTVATNPTAGTKVANPNAISISGLYYLYSRANTGGCFSNASNAVTVTITPCLTCTNPGDFTPGGTPTKMGITVQQKQEGWPTNIPNGFIALQSQNKGMVITRVVQVGGGTGGVPNLTTDSIKDPKEGMLVYDLAANCVKLFNGTIWKCLAKDCN